MGKVGAMARDHQINLRLNAKELAKLKAFAEAEDLSVSEVLRDYIKTLPSPTATDQAGPSGSAN